MPYSNKAQTVLVGKNKVSFKDGDYVASGGQGTVWRKGQLGVKIYHDPKHMIPPKKIQELSLATPDNVIAPRDIVTDKKGKAIGFSFKFIDSSHPLCKIFTTKFRTKVGFTEQGAVDLIQMMQETVAQIHKESFLIVDLNEMNFLLDKALKIAYFIDVDSWQTQTYKASALMESVRDRLVKNQQFTEDSDWFSFAVVVFQIYIGIHPYKGKHPDFLPKEWSQRMDEGVSVLDPKVQMPKSCRPLSVIPPAHMKWFEAIFLRNERLAPPLPDGIGMIPAADLVVVITGNEKFMTNVVGKYPDNVLYVYSHDNDNYTLTRKHLYVTSKGPAPVVDGLDDFDKVLICDSPGDKPLLCKMKDGNVEMQEILRTTNIDSTKAEDIMVRDGRLYVARGNSVFEIRFHKGVDQVFHATKRVCGYTENSTHMFEGVIYRDVLGQPYFCIPYRSGSAFNDKIEEIEDHRVLGAKSQGNILVVLAEKDGLYHRFIIVFDENFRTYNVRKVEDVQYESINFTKIDGGPCILVSGDDRIEVFVDNRKIKEIDAAPFDASMRLFNSRGKVFFINGKEIQQVEMK